MFQAFFDQYQIPPDILDERGHADYRNFPVIMQEFGKHRQYSPIGWVRFGLNIQSRYEKYPHWIVDRRWTSCFYTCNIRKLKPFLLSGVLQLDKRDQLVYVSPYIELLQNSCQHTFVYKDQLGIQAPRRLKVILQCKIPEKFIEQLEDPSPHFYYYSLEKPVWRVPAPYLRPYGLCVKQMQGSNFFINSQLTV